MDLSFNSCTSIEARRKNSDLCLGAAGLTLIVGHIADSFDVTNLGVVGYFRPMSAV